MPFGIGALHAVKALHTVYGGRWARTLLRAAVIAAAYALLLGVAVMAVVLPLA